MKLRGKKPRQVEQRVVLHISKSATKIGEDPSPIPRTSPYFRACEVWDGIRMGSAVGTGDIRRHLKSFETFWNHLNHFRSHEALEAFTEKLHRQLAEASVGVAPRNSPSPFPDGLYYWSLSESSILLLCHYYELFAISSSAFLVSAADEMSSLPARPKTHQGLWRNNLLVLHVAQRCPVQTALLRSD